MRYFVSGPSCLSNRGLLSYDTSNHLPLHLVRIFSQQEAAQSVRSLQ